MWLDDGSTIRVVPIPSDPIAALRGQGSGEGLGATILWENNERLLLQASRLKANYQLSLADCLIAAQGLRQGSVLVHRDPEYRQLTTELELEELPSA